MVALSSGVDLLLQSSIQISLCDNILASKLAGRNSQSNRLILSHRGCLNAIDFDLFNDVRLSASGNASQFGTFGISHQAAAFDLIHFLTQLGSHSGGLDIVTDAKRVNHLGDISHDSSFLVSTADTGKDTIQTSDVISHLCGTRGVTQNPVSDLLQSVVRLVGTSHNLCDFLRRDSAYRLAGILTDQGVNSSLSSLTVDQSLQSRSQIVVGDLTLACQGAQTTDLTVDVSLSCLKSNLQLRQGSNLNSVCHNTFLLLE